MLRTRLILGREVDTVLANGKEEESGEGQKSTYMDGFYTEQVLVVKVISRVKEAGIEYIVLVMVFVRIRREGLYIGQLVHRTEVITLC